MGRWGWAVSGVVFELIERGGEEEVEEEAEDENVGC